MGSHTSHFNADSMLAQLVLTLWWEILYVLSTDAQSGPLGVVYRTMSASSGLNRATCIHHMEMGLGWTRVAVGRHSGSPSVAWLWDRPASQPRHGHSQASEIPKYCGGHLGWTPSTSALAGVHTRAAAEQHSDSVTTAQCACVHVCVCVHVQDLTCSVCCEAFMAVTGLPLWSEMMDRQTPDSVLFTVTTPPAHPDSTLLPGWGGREDSNVQTPGVLFAVSTLTISRIVYTGDWAVMRPHFHSLGHLLAVKRPQASIRVPHSTPNPSWGTLRAHIHTSWILQRATLGFAHLGWAAMATPASYLTLPGVEKDARSSSGRHHIDTDPSAQVVAREFPKIAHDVTFS